VHGQFEVVAGAQDVAAEEAGLVGLAYGVLHATQHVHDFATDVDEGVMRPDRVGGDDHALHELVR
jgi:hypothetical protein